MARTQVRTRLRRDLAGRGSGCVGAASRPSDATGVLEDRARRREGGDRSRSEEVLRGVFPSGRPHRRGAGSGREFDVAALILLADAARIAELCLGRSSSAHAARTYIVGSQSGNCGV